MERNRLLLRCYVCNKTVTKKTFFELTYGFIVVVNCAFIFWEMFHLKTHHNCQHFKSIPFKCSIHLVNFALLQFHESYTWISFFNQLFCYGWKVHTHICLHSTSIPEWWKVKKEESHSISNDEQGSDQFF